MCEVCTEVRKVLERFAMSEVATFAAKQTKCVAKIATGRLARSPYATSSYQRAIAGSHRQQMRAIEDLKRVDQRLPGLTLLSDSARMDRA